MKQATKLSLTLLAGFALGAGAIQGLHAQASGKKPGYFVSEVDVTDQAGFQAYAKKATETVKAAGGRFLVVGKAETKEGAPVTGTIVIAAFDSLADVEKWYGSPSYQPLIAERQKTAKTRLFFAEGMPQ